MPVTTFAGGKTLKRSTGEPALYKMLKVPPVVMSRIELSGACTAICVPVKGAVVGRVVGGATVAVLEAHRTFRQTQNEAQAQATATDFVKSFYSTLREYLPT